MRDFWIFRVLLASRAARELGIYRHLGMAKAWLCVQAPPEDHFARSEHGLDFRLVCECHIESERGKYRIGAEKRWLHPVRLSFRCERRVNWNLEFLRHLEREEC